MIYMSSDGLAEVGNRYLLALHSRKQGQALTDNVVSK
jgi:hypothetical protein